MNAAFQASSNSGNLLPSTLPQSCDVGLTLACSYAHPPALPGGCPFPIRSVSALLLLSTFFLCVGRPNVFFSTRLCYWSGGKEVLLHRDRRGVCVPVSFPHCRLPLSLLVRAINLEDMHPGLVAKFSDFAPRLFQPALLVFPAF